MIHKINEPKLSVRLRISISIIRKAEKNSSRFTVQTFPGENSLFTLFFPFLTEEEQVNQTKRRKFWKRRKMSERI